MIVLATATLLAGCVTARSNVAVKIVCPPIASYDKAMLQAAYAEYQSLQAGSKLKTLINDYQVLRDKVRACRP